MFSGFQWFPKKWGKRKVSEQFHQSKFADEGKGILITIYAIDLYFISIPLKVKNIISFNHKYILYLKVGVEHRKPFKEFVLNIKYIIAVLL
ncbi:hypothetical protein AAHH76_04720 [Bacillus toyonensis]